LACFIDSGLPTFSRTAGECPVPAGEVRERLPADLKLSAPRVILPVEAISSEEEFP
jgi:hypothetical protein